LPAGLFATRAPDLLDRLVLFGPVVPRHEKSTGTSADQRALAWNVTIDAQRQRFYGYVPTGERPVLAESDMKLWWPAYLATDPDSFTRNPPSVRVPSGPLADIDLAWTGASTYDPALIRAPTLIIRGEWDDVTTNADASRLYRSLRNTPIKRDVVVSRGTHVMHLEESRFQLYSEVQAFLEGKDTDPTRGR
jgi:pimeloyl-ACP methyl ester carboxylesterase